MEKLETIIIGGGPCGSYTALNLAEKNIKVAVFEEHEKIGLPTHCAGHLSIEGLKNLGLYPLPKEVLENVFYGAKFYSPSGREFLVKFNEPVTCIVNREKFDEHIANLAKKAGATYFLNSPVKSLIIENGKVNGVLVQQNGKKLRFMAPVIVDAEGANAKLLRQTYLESQSRGAFVYGFQVEVEGVEDLDPNVVEVFLGKEYAPGFYAWIIPKKEQRAKVGLAAGKGNLRELMHKFMHKHPAASPKLRKVRILRESIHPINLGGPIPKAYSDGFLIVGDAASHVKPTTGGGVILGLNCAKIAADVAAEAIENEDYTAKFLSRYQKRTMKLIGFDMKVMLTMRKMLNQISDGGLDRLLGFCRKIRLEKAVKDIREIDFQGRIIIREATKPGVLAFAVYLFMVYFFSKR
ncbi:MAG: NAD(P)/FAD-dependent oxidoreductase [Candidatus Bathyarchaeota archaeon]|nr:NAD(P)/FAD-dependent oxidoreductase [Candidatus Bathyarchaeota archaeon]